MIVRPCNINDLDDLVPLFDSYRQRFKQSSEPVAVREYLRQRIENEQATIFLAFDQEIGLSGFVLLYPSFSSIGLAPIWLLNDFYIHSGKNKNQMATKMLDAAIELCKSSGSIRIEVTTRRENHRLHNLYKEHGFEKDYRYDHYFKRVNSDLQKKNSLK